MEILRGYGLETNICILLHRFGDEKVVVLKSVRYYGRSFRKDRGVNQGDPVYPKVFNIIVDAVVREVLLEVCGPHEANH